MSESTTTNLNTREVYEKIVANIETVMRGQSSSIRKLLAGFVTGGHVLLDDYPGTGKTNPCKGFSPLYCR